LEIQWFSLWTCFGDDSVFLSSLSYVCPCFKHSEFQRKSLPLINIPSIHPSSTPVPLGAQKSSYEWKIKIGFAITTSRKREAQWTSKIFCSSLELV
jgi:hypothetical protein